MIIHSALFVTRSNQFLRIQLSVLVIFCMLYIQVCLGIFDNCACAIAEAINSRSKTIIQVMLCSISYVLDQVLYAKDRHLQKKQKILKSNLGRKSEDCPVTNETVDKNTNHQFRHIEFWQFNWIKLPRKVKIQQRRFTFSSASQY